MNTRALTIAQLNQLSRRKQNKKRQIHDRIRRGVEELNELLIQYWDQASYAYLSIEEDFNYRGAVFEEIRHRFLDNNIAIRFNPALLNSGIRELQFRKRPAP